MTYKSIFLADDDYDDVQFFTDALNEISTNSFLTVFCNGAELLNGLNNNKQLPDIFFIDINMPFMNGLKALALIKENPAFNFIPIVIYSTYSNMCDITKAYQLGASSYFKKPSNFNSLKEQLKGILLIDWNNFMRPGNYLSS